MRTVAVIDYGMGNLRSVAQAVMAAAHGSDVKVVITANPEEVHAAERVVLPGQGAMRDCMQELNDSGLLPAVLDAAAHKPLFGVCVGMQMLLDHSADADFEASKQVVATLVEAALSQGIPEGVCLNVNIPKALPSAIAGIRICHQAKGYWADNFDVRTDPYGKPYYWLTGEFKLMDEGLDTDEIALAAGYVSVVPVHFDLTAYQAMEKLKQWNL
jgi:5'/3'-nucleotidase SurE